MRIQTLFRLQDEYWGPPSFADPPNYERYERILAMLSEAKWDEEAKTLRFPNYDSVCEVTLLHCLSFSSVKSISTAPRQYSRARQARLEELGTEKNEKFVYLLFRQ